MALFMEIKRPLSWGLVHISLKKERKKNKKKKKVYSKCHKIKKKLRTQIMHE